MCHLKVFKMTMPESFKKSNFEDTFNMYVYILYYSNTNVISLQQITFALKILITGIGF